MIVAQLWSGFWPMVVVGMCWVVDSPPFSVPLVGRGFEEGGSVDVATLLLTVTVVMLCCYGCLGRRMVDVAVVGTDELINSFEKCTFFNN